VGFESLEPPVRKIIVSILLKEMFSDSLFKPYSFFGIRGLSPVAEKSIKVLGKGFGEQPFFKRVTPQLYSRKGK
jgi:hypothetical protein